MSKKIKSSQIVSSLGWDFAEKWACQIINFIITIIIARVLNPEAYGIVAIVNAFISIFGVFVDSGLGNSLVQKKDADSLDYSTVFYTNIVLCGAVYFILFVLAPFVENYYQMENLSLLIRVSGSTLLLFSIKNVQHAYISKNLLFRKLFFSSLFGTVGSGILGIWMAFNGYGVWALVCSHLFDVIFDTLIIWFTIKWRPTLEFSFERLKRLYNYGWKLFVSSIINKIYKKSSQLVIGKYYSSADLAYYDKGDTIAGKITVNVDGAVNSVLFPVLSNNQYEKSVLKNISKNTLKINFYIMTPLLVGLLVVSRPMVIVLLTEKWLPAVPYIIIYCLLNILLPFHSMNLSIIKSIGRSDIFLKLEVIKKIIGITALIVNVKYGPLYIALGQLVVNIICIFINSYPNKKFINYSIFEQIKDVFPIIIIVTIMGLIVNIFNFIEIDYLLKLIIQIVTGGVVYIGLSYLFKIDVFENIIRVIKEKFHHAK